MIVFKQMQIKKSNNRKERKVLQRVQREEQKKIISRNRFLAKANASYTPILAFPQGGRDKTFPSWGKMKGGEKPFMMTLNISNSFPDFIYLCCK
jgi:hypothetical protein